MEESKTRHLEGPSVPVARKCAGAAQLGEETVSTAARTAPQDDLIASAHVMLPKKPRGYKYDVPGALNTRSQWLEKQTYGILVSILLRQSVFGVLINLKQFSYSLIT